jgi:hypothetical protein
MMKQTFFIKVKKSKNHRLFFYRITLIFSVIFCSSSYCQCEIKFNKKKWIADEIDSILMTTSYRAYIVDECSFIDMIRGKTKLQIKQLLGEPDYRGNNKSFRKGRKGFVYCFGKNTKNNKRGCQSAFVIIFFDNGIASEFLRVFSGG